MRLRTIVGAAGIALAGTACSSGSNSVSTTTGPSAVNTIAAPTSMAVPSTPTFDLVGVCNEAVLWAVNDNETTGLRIRARLFQKNRSTQVIDLAHAGAPIVELQRGTSLRMLLCGDISDETYAVTSTAMTTRGTVIFSFGAGRGDASMAATTAVPS